MLLMMPLHTDRPSLVPLPTGLVVNKGLKTFSMVSDINSRLVEYTQIDKGVRRLLQMGEKLIDSALICQSIIPMKIS
jgi:hypothetical protein